SMRLKETSLGRRKDSPQNPTDQVLWVCLTALESFCMSASSGATTLRLLVATTVPADRPVATLNSSRTRSGVASAVKVPRPSFPPVSVPLPEARNHLRPPSEAAVTAGLAVKDRSTTSATPTLVLLRPEKLSCGV